MAVYVAFLRGINVGGRNLIKMKEVCQEFESIGREKVSSFRASGNILFISELEPADVVEKTKKRNDFLDKYCEKIGRDPGSLRRSLLIFGAEANTAFASEEHFIEIVERYQAIGINEFVFFYPFFAPEQISTFEKIAKETIPTLRKS